MSCLSYLYQTSFKQTEPGFQVSNLTEDALGYLRVHSRYHLVTIMIFSQPAQYTRHNTLLHTYMILHPKNCFAPSCHMRQKTLYDTKMSYSTLPHPRTAHMSSCTSKYDNIKHKNYSIKKRFRRVRPFHSWLNQKQVDRNKNSSWIISLLVES